MYVMIKNYVMKMTKEDCQNFAIKNNISLNDEELDFVYNFIKKNYNELLINPNIDLSKFKKHFTDENYIKINKLLIELKQKYAYLIR